MTGRNNSKKVIIVLGDWFIDENWVVAKHHSYTSTHTGEEHYNSKFDKTAKRYLNLCGAAEVLEILRSHIISDDLYKNSFDLYGFGTWSEADNKIIQCTICPERFNEKYASAFAIMGIQEPSKADNPAEGLNERECLYGDHKCKYSNAYLVNLTKKGYSNSTNHVIRCYESNKDETPHLLYRFDSILPVKDISVNKFREFLCDKEVIAVIVEDHDRGVVDNNSVSQLIKALKENTIANFENIKWYVRSKAENPLWLTELNNDNITIQLRIIDFQLAKHKRGQRNWEYEGELGRLSLELLGELTAKEKSRGENEAEPSYPKFRARKAAILMDENKAIGIDENICFNLNQPAGPTQSINVGRTTVFFSALIAQDLFGPYTDDPFDVHCNRAIKCAFDRSSLVSDEWNTKGSFMYLSYQDALSLLKTYSPTKVKGKDYDKLWIDWNASSRNYGCIDNREFHIWRGIGILKDLLCVGGPKRTAINELVTKIHKYNIVKEHVHSLNCLLVGSPGWGKSYLAHSIANYCDMHFLEYSISQMASTSDLVDCFDTICSVQNRVHKKLLILVDEINCHIEGHSALGLLLSPIWDGTFIRNGKIYKISPAVWIFASTMKYQDLLFSDENKGSDFISRINGPLIELDLLEPECSSEFVQYFNNIRAKYMKAPTDSDIYKDPYYLAYQSLDLKTKTEQVYIGVSLLEKYWGPISLIDEEVLKLFHDMIPIYGFRSIEFFISLFKNIQYGIVHRHNVALYEDYIELKRHILLPQTWDSKEAKLLHIKIDSPDDPNLIKIIATNKKA